MVSLLKEVDVRNLAHIHRLMNVGGVYRGTVCGEILKVEYYKGFWFLYTYENAYVVWHRRFLNFGSVEGKNIMLSYGLYK